MPSSSASSNGSPSTGGPPVPHQFLVGCAQVDITPPLGTILGVDFVPHYARHIHDPLYAKAMYFERGKTNFLIIVVDICIMESDYMYEIKEAIWDQTGIPPGRTLLASNHNHASGAVVGLLGGAPDVDYKRKLPGLIVEAADKAAESAQPAKIAYGAADVPDFVICRRYLMQEGYEARNPVTHQNDGVKTNPFGGENQIIKSVAEPDPELSYLLIKSLDDQWLGVLANYGLHYVGDWPEDSVTGDYFGEFAARLKENLGADDGFVAMMSNGTSGDVNLWSFQDPDRFPTGDYAKTQLVGGTLAQKVAEDIENLEWHEKPDLRNVFDETEIALRKPSAAELEAASKSFISKDFKNLGYDPESVQRIYDREQVLLSQYPDTKYLETQMFKIGELRIGALPGEFFAETGLKLKQEIPGPYFSINLANSYGGYIPPAHELDRGGYETWRARSSCMERDAEEKIRKSMIELARKLTEQNA